MNTDGFSNAGGAPGQTPLPGKELQKAFQLRSAKTGIGKTLADGGAGSAQLVLSKEVGLWKTPLL
jgi:hypothetical protein